MYTKLKKLEKEELESLYNQSHLTTDEIGKLYDVSGTAISYHLKKYNIKFKPYNKLCALCNNSFIVPNYDSRDKKVCSKKCENNEYYVNIRRPLEISPKTSMICKCCGKKFLGWVHNRYCTKGCKKIIGREQKKVYDLRHKMKNLEKLKKYWKFYHSQTKNKERYKAWCRNKRRVDAHYAITGRIRTLTNIAIRRYRKEGKIMFSKKYLIDYKGVIEHLKPFPEDISKYHIDHIRPLRSFDLSNKEEFKKAFAPENHQWLTKEENLSKGGKYL